MVFCCLHLKVINILILQQTFPNLVNLVKGIKPDNTSLVSETSIDLPKLGGNVFRRETVREPPTGPIPKPRITAYQDSDSEPDDVDDTTDLPNEQLDAMEFGFIGADDDEGEV